MFWNVKARIRSISFPPAIAKRKLLASFDIRAIAPSTTHSNAQKAMACGGLYLVDAVTNRVRGCGPKGINHLPEDDGHYHHRHAIAQRPNHADQHQHDVGAVRVLEHLIERHLGHRHGLLAILLSFTTFHYISSSCCGAFFCHVVPARCQCCFLVCLQLTAFARTTMMQISVQVVSRQGWWQDEPNAK
ncbi:hypothetical protein SETIT_3G159800v2 [Setaria italica]|uniref:Uncharacterized protein n=1 Tax=Setaria italica TaxID=4555 RepID=A0A368QHG2_SETIT|nr:hypothetical protein SETIT_3G159800v2 [Setaria italica]